MKVGDRVIIQSTVTSFNMQWEGTGRAIGVITGHAINDPQDMWYFVRFPNGYTNAYGENHLELADGITLNAAEYEEIMAAQALMEGAK